MGIEKTGINPRYHLSVREDSKAENRAKITVGLFTLGLILITGGATMWPQIEQQVIWPFLHRH